MENRKYVIRLLVLSTLLFALLLASALLLGQKMPEIRAARVEKALAAENFAQARRVAGRIREEGTARVYRQRCDYLEARQRMEAGDMAGAEALLASLGNYEDAAARLQDCRYALALEAKENGDWEAAIALLESLSGRDVLAELDECRYGLAAQLAAAGADTEALALYGELGDYRDSRALMGELAVKVSGIGDPEMAIQALSGLSAEDLAQQEELSARRAALPVGILDVGHRHTVGLRSDGSVLACGDNGFGQCDVGSWTDVRAVAAGAYHTAALLADGSVVCTGRSSEGQCATEDWCDIVEIAAGDYATFGLKSDGTVVCTGYSEYPAVSGWSGLDHIYSGSYALGALRGGTAFLSHEGARSEELKGLVALALNSGYAVGLRSVGTVASPGFELDWKRVVALSCSGTGVLGLTADGAVLSHYFRPGDAPDFSAVTDAVAIAAGGTHSAVAFSDGSVKVFGRSEEGQADTGDWKLF